jgi:polar amino acid transport system substrate-binding protein
MSLPKLLMPSMVMAMICVSYPSMADSNDAALPTLYVAAQATKGKVIYAKYCAECHGKELVGGTAPALSGTQFFTRDMNTKLGGVFEYMARQMPLGRPGSLTHDEYAQLMAFILQKNGFPSGDSPLSYDAILKSDDILYFAKH